MFKLILMIVTLITNLNNPLSMNAGDISVVRKTFSLEDRYSDKFVNGVFKDNILLTLNYMQGNVNSKSEINWNNIEKPNSFIFTLRSGEGFAFHDQILPKYVQRIVKTTNAHFDYKDGFRSDGYLMGDGVCHLASLMYWAAKDAGLDAFAPTNHDFAKINEVPKEYGVAIYNLPGAFNTSAMQNLYINNNTSGDVSFIFNYDGNDLSVNVVKTLNRS